MIGMEVLKPLAVLAGWTMVMWLWMYATRIPAMNAAKIDSKTLVGGTGKDLDAVLPGKVQWIAHNYNHLHEAPTVFYAVVLALALVGQGDGLNAQLAWAYVGLRIAHSLVQAISNRVMVRFMLVAWSSLGLRALTLHRLIGWSHNAPGGRPGHPAAASLRDPARRTPRISEHLAKFNLDYPAARIHVVSLVRDRHRAAGIGDLLARIKQVFRP